MKKTTFTFLLLMVILSVKAQTTYYWVGGADATSFTANSNWNTQLNGSGDSRSVLGAQNTDILVFDGTNIGGANVVTGTVNAVASSHTCAQLIVRNGASVHLRRDATGSATITINGGSGDDLVVDATSTLTVAGPSASFDVFIVLATGTTGKINGTVFLSPLSNSVHTRSYITVPTGASLSFENGAAIHITDSTASSGFNGSAANSITFKSGSSLYYYSGRSPIGSSSTVQFVIFEVGSNLYFRGSNVQYTDGGSYSSSSWLNNKTFANIFLENGATITADGPVYKIENLTISTGSTFRTHTTGNTPILGNLVVNGTLSANTGATTNSVNMAGNTPQTVSGSGTINIMSFGVANHSSVTLQKSINVSNLANIVGRLDFGADNQITGTAAFTARTNGTAGDLTGNTTAGSYLITGVTGTQTGNTNLAVTCTTPGILSANTNCTGFGTGFIYLSQPALATATGVTLKFSSDSATLVTSNVNGFSETNGSVITTGTKAYQTGTNYIINAATTSPFGVTTGNTTAFAGNVTLNAPITSNATTRISGVLRLNNGKLIIRATDTIRLTSPLAIAGEPFSSSKYIVTEKSVNTVGVLRADAVTGEKLYPIGSSNYYLPVSVTSTTDDAFALSVFEGATNDGSVNGTAFNATQKQTVVDAIWNINRLTANTDAANLKLNWNAALEGSSFTNFTNPQIGVSRFDGNAWTIASATSANNTTNEVVASSNLFGSFGIGLIATTLPVQFKNVTATKELDKAVIHWQSQNESSLDVYVIEKSKNGINFTEVATVNAASNNLGSTYKWMDISSNEQVAYYRIKAVAKNGVSKYSPVVFIQLSSAIQLRVYPNPTADKLTISGLLGNEKIFIYDALGTLKMQQFVNANMLVTTVQVQNLPKGVYTVKVVGSTRTSTQLFSKQ